MARMVKVWEVQYDCGGDGRYGDGKAIARYRDAKDANDFAAGELNYGHPARANLVVVPARVADRWGV